MKAENKFFKKRIKAIIKLLENLQDWCYGIIRNSAWTSSCNKQMKQHSKDYIIAQVILAFWLVFAYDLLEGRLTIDIISVTKFFLLCFKMAERFENLYNILRDWAKEKIQKSLLDALNRY